MTMKGIFWMDLGKGDRLQFLTYYMQVLFTYCISLIKYVFMYVYIYNIYVSGMDPKTKIGGGVGCCHSFSIGQK